MNVVYIPRSLYGAIRRSLLSTNDLKNFSALLNTLSVEDVGFYLYCNSPEAGVIPEDVSEFATNLVEDVKIPEQHVSRINGKLKDFKHNGAKCDIYEEGSVLVPDCISYEDLIVLTHITPDEQSTLDLPALKLSFYDRLIEQLFVVKDPHTVMSSSVMRGWIEAAKTA